MRTTYSRAKLGPQGYPFDDDPPKGLAALLRDPRDMLHEPESAKVLGAAKRAASNRTAGQWRRFKRNLLIYGGYQKLGFTQRQLADVFGLPRSRISSIIAECREFESARGTSA